MTIGVALCFLLTGCPEDKPEKKPTKHTTAGWRAQHTAYRGPRHYKCGDKHPEDVMVRCEFDSIYKGEPHAVLGQIFLRVLRDNDETTLWKAGDRRGRYVIVWKTDNVGAPTTVNYKAFYPAPPIAGE